MTIQASRGPVARPVSDEARDDAVVPFAVEPLDVRGRVVRLGATIDHILAKHGYPTPVARLVGEACVLTVLLAIIAQDRRPVSTANAQRRRHRHAGRRLRYARPFARACAVRCR